MKTKTIDRRVLRSLLEVANAQYAVATGNIHDELYNSKGNHRGMKPRQSALDQWFGQEMAAEEMAKAIVEVAHDCRYKIPIPKELREAGVGRSRF